MYTQDFYIEDPVGNNAFSYEKRENKQLFVPKIKEIQSLDEIELLETSKEHITFEEYDFYGKMQQCYGLKNLYALTLTLSQGEREQAARNIPLYLVDNHNHVFYFWYLARMQGLLSDGVLLYHIDEHADMRDPWKYLLKPESEDLQKVFEYTNFFLNVGNYIIPAQKEGLIDEIVQIRSEANLDSYEQWFFQKLETGRNIILNLDLDFFEPELDYIEYEHKKRVILDIAEKADLITVCTSPYFIDQERALNVMKDIFD